MNLWKGKFGIGPFRLLVPFWWRLYAVDVHGHVLGLGLALALALCLGLGPGLCLGLNGRLGVSLTLSSE